VRTNFCDRWMNGQNEKDITNSANAHFSNMTNTCDYYISPSESL